MEAGVHTANVPFARKKLKDGTTLPLSERERIEQEKAIKLAERTNARLNLEWMRVTYAGAHWSDEDHQELISMLGLEDIDVEG